MEFTYYIKTLFAAICAGMIFVAPALGAGETPELKHGLNLSSWLANAPRQPLFARDFAQIRQAGFDHVRLPFNPEYVGYRLEPKADPSHIDFIALDRAVALAEQYNLAVILDLHPDGAFEETLERHVWAENDVVALWKVLAERYASHPASALMFELLNEPQYYKSEAVWNKLAARLVKTIHAVSPDRVVVVGAPHGSEIDALPLLQPLNDPQVIYAFHFYEPYLITHQGIHMGFETKMIRAFRHLPYPSALATATAAVYAPAARNPVEAQKELVEYKNTPWDENHIAARIDVARDWAAHNHVRVLCGEYGVLRNHIDISSRYRWIHDARAAMDADGIGWELWDYADLFGIATPVGPTSTDPIDGSVRLMEPETGSRVLESGALSALGLEAIPSP